MRLLDRLGNALGYMLAIGFVTAMVIAPALSEPVYVKNCSGTYIGQGYVLTAGHCVDQAGLFVAKENPIHDEPGAEAEQFTAKVVWSAGERDVGVIRLDKALVKTTKTEREEEDKGKFKEDVIKDIPFTATKISCALPKIGDKLTMKGWPAGHYVEVSGVVASKPRKLRHDYSEVWEKVQFVAMPGTSGNSGSGVMNEADEVVAVMVGGLPGSGLMVHVPIVEVCNILPRDIN